MSIELRRFSELSPAQVTGLELAMAVFYRNAPATYYQIADLTAQQYNRAERPFHCDLIGHVSPGMSVIELGCGTAHLCPRVEERGGIYTGVDHGDALLKQNRHRFPNARFFSVGAEVPEIFDLVASLYTIEHVVNPTAYLESLWAHCRPGGLIGILCPEFVECPCLPPSFLFGHAPGRLREKIRRLRLWDALKYVLDLKWRAPRWQAAARADTPGAFWINLRPRVLHGAEYEIDADAVHMTRLRDLVWFLKQKGAEIICTSADLPDVSPKVLRFNCYVLVRKP